MNQEIVNELVVLVKICKSQQDQLNILIKVSEELLNKVAALEIKVLELQGKEK
jgi:hypothetical protein